MVNLDTHILLAAVERKLRPDEVRVMDHDFWCISDIVLWEIGQLAQAGQIRIGLDNPELRRAVDQLTVWPIDFRTARAAHSLDFRSDPADQLIAATSVARDIPLVTRDTRILSSKIVPLPIH